MVVNVSSHAVKRYKQRVTGKKTTSGQKCTEQIKGAIKHAHRIVKLRETNSQYNFGAYYYYTDRFIAVTQRHGCCLFVITIKMYQDKKEVV